MKGRTACEGQFSTMNEHFQQKGNLSDVQWPIGLERVRVGNDVNVRIVFTYFTYCVGSRNGSPRINIPGSQACACGLGTFFATGVCLFM